ncbi:MAG: helix-turn-helix transcriptional regulator, partial [Candidatus Lokiarchaeota archaeon]|nr:helix-turn-helix transcriptional regulator [Candidatus Lokiarchaeota archaeon]
MENGLETLVKTIPKPVLSAIQALQNPRRFSIAILLLESGKQSLSFLGRATQSENVALIPQLNILVESGIVEKELLTRVGKEQYSYYLVTAFGKQLIEVIASSVASTRLPMLKALANPLRFALARHVLASGPISFSGVVAITGLEKSAVAAHLGKLEAGGLLEKEFSRDKESGEYSMYKATRAAKDVIPRLMLLDQYWKITREVKNIAKQEQVLATLREAIMGAGAATDADFCHEVLDLQRSLVDAMLAAADAGEKKAHAKKLA